MTKRLNTHCGTKEKGMRCHYWRCSHVLIMSNTSGSKSLRVSRYSYYTTKLEYYQCGAIRIFKSNQNSAYQWWSCFWMFNGFGVCQAWCEKDKNPPVFFPARNTRLYDTFSNPPNITLVVKKKNEIKFMHKVCFNFLNSNICLILLFYFCRHKVLESIRGEWS